MAQYIQVQGTSFGNAHSDNPTYAFTEGSGAGIYLSGSGGYVNAATGITKATLTSGVKLKVENDLATAVTCSVESGFTCTNEFEYATWTIVSPTPTPSPQATSTVSVTAEENVTGNVTYRVVFAINGFKSSTIDVVGNAGQSTADLFITGTPDGSGTVTVTRISPDGTVDADTDVTPTVSGCSISPSTTQTTSSGNTLSQVFNVTLFSHGDSIDISISEGGAP